MSPDVFEQKMKSELARFFDQRGLLDLVGSEMQLSATKVGKFLTESVIDIRMEDDPLKKLAGFEKMNNTMAEAIKHIRRICSMNDAFLDRMQS